MNNKKNKPNISIVGENCIAQKKETNEIKYFEKEKAKNNENYSEILEKENEKENEIKVPTGSIMY